MHYAIIALMHGSHGLSARRARRKKSRGPKGLQLEVGARRAPRLLVTYNITRDNTITQDNTITPVNTITQANTITPGTFR